MIIHFKKSLKMKLLITASAVIALSAIAPVFAADEVGRRIEMSLIERASGFSGIPDIPAEQLPSPPVEFREIESGSGKKKITAETAYIESADGTFSMPADIKNFDLRCSTREKSRMAAVIKIREMAKLLRGALPERYNETMEKITKLAAGVDALPGPSLNDLCAVAELLKADAASLPFAAGLCSGSKLARRYADIAEEYPVEPMTRPSARANIEKVREIAAARLKTIAANDSARRILIEKNNKAVEEARKTLKKKIDEPHFSRGREAVDSFNLGVAAYHEELLNFLRYNYYQFMQLGDAENARKIFNCRVVNGKCEFSGEFMDEYDGLPARLDFRYLRRDGFGGTRTGTMPVEQFKYKRSFDSMLGVYCLEEMKMSELLPLKDRTAVAERVRSCLDLSENRFSSPLDEI